jgi:hypothetical protein
MSELTLAIFIHPFRFDLVERDPLVQLINADLFNLSDGSSKPIRQRDKVVPERIAP